MAKELEVSACSMWVETPVWVEPGDRIDFHAEGIWVDAVIPCSADGYSAPVFYALHRPPRIPDGDRYFRLMGRISPTEARPTRDDLAATFPIGAGCQWTATQAGRVFVFANDRPGYYWNNWGKVRLRIARNT